MSYSPGNNALIENNEVVSGVTEIALPYSFYICRLTPQNVMFLPSLLICDGSLNISSLSRTFELSIIFKVRKEEVYVGERTTCRICWLNG